MAHMNTAKKVKNAPTAKVGKKWETPDMGQGIKILGAVGGAAVVFYAVGFVTVQSFLFRNGYEGMFWITNEFYRDAGAKFLLEMVRAPLTAWYFFLPYLALLYLLFVPRRDNLNFAEEAWPERLLHNAQCVGLIIAMAGTYVVALNYGDCLGYKPFATLISRVFIDPTGGASESLKQSLAFFCIVMPMSLTVAVFLFKFYGALRPGSAARGWYHFTALSFVVYLAVIPISFGMHLYDWKIVAVKDPRALGERYAAPHSIPSQMWFVGEFGGRYLFLRQDASSPRRIFDSVDVKEIKQLNIDLRDTGSLKYLIETLNTQNVNQGYQIVADELRRTKEKDQ
jgi:hypothetical protein